MERHIGKRAVISLGIFWLGFHFIGLLIWKNDGGRYDNIVWTWFQAVLSLELLVLKILIIILPLSIFTFAALTFYSSKLKQMRINQNQITPKIPEQNSLGADQSIQKIDFQPTLYKTRPANPSPSSTQNSPPTAAELKLRAFKQITGKDYFNK